MPRPRLTDQERKQRKRDSFAKILQGRPNPEGIKGNERLWAGEAAEFIRLAGLTPEELREESRDRLLRVIGLFAEPTSKEELKKARNIAIRKVHPDLGGTGSVEQTKAVNLAFEEIMRRNGWR